MNGIKMLVFGSQIIVVGMFIAWRANSSSMRIFSHEADARLGLLLILVGLVISFFGLRQPD